VAESKYAKYVNPLRLWTEAVRPSYRGKMADFSLLFDEQVYPDTPLWVETFYAYAPGTGVGVPGELPVVFNGKTMENRENWGQHAHPDFDELFLFFGTNPYDNTRLGGEVEAWLGEGENAQKFIIKDPTAKWVPKDLAHNPWIVTKVDDPKYPIIIMVIALSPRYNVKQNNWRDLPHPPAFSMDKLGVPQPGKGLYTKNVKKMPLAQDRIFPWQRGRVAVPTIMFDYNCIPNIPVWVEIFHVYAAGTGIGVPSLEGNPARQMPDGKIFDMRKGMSHGHDFDELFLFIPCDPHDTLNLGGEVDTYLGKGKDAERFTLTKSSSVWVPANLHHNPQYYKRVDRPYLMVVIATTKDYFGEGKMDIAPIPPIFEW
jgi:hypothetical protein